MPQSKPQIRVEPDGPSDSDAIQLRDDLQRDLEDYQIKLVSKGGIRGRSPSAPEVLSIYLPQLAVAVMPVVLEKCVEWSWKRWKSRRAVKQRIVLYGPDNEVLSVVEVPDGSGDTLTESASLEGHS